MRVNLAIGAALTALSVGAALIAPAVLRSVLDALFPPVLIGMAAALLVVSAVRRILLGPAHEQKLPLNALLVAYFLAALPLGVAALSLGALVTLALVFQWQPRFDLVQSFLLLLVGFVLFSMAVKIVLEVRMLMRHWLRR